MLVQTKGLVYGVLSCLLASGTLFALIYLGARVPLMMSWLRVEASLDFWSKTSGCTWDGVLDLETKAFGFHPGSVVPELCDSG